MSKETHPHPQPPKEIPQAPPTLPSQIKAHKLNIGDVFCLNNISHTVESVSHHPDKGYISIITESCAFAFTQNQNIIIKK